MLSTFSAAEDATTSKISYNSSNSNHELTKLGHLLESPGEYPRLSPERIAFR